MIIALVSISLVLVSSLFAGRLSNLGAGMPVLSERHTTAAWSF